MGPILIIEDDEDDRFFIRNAIKQCGITNDYRFFDNGKQALDYLIITSEQPFLILCDINMPVMNGIQLSRTINANDYLRKKSIPFIFLTTTDSPIQVKEAYELTVQGFFKKPPSIEELTTIIKGIYIYWANCLHPNNV